MKRFGDFGVQEGFIVGDKVKIEEILNEEILITGYTIKESKYNKNKSGKCLTLQFDKADTKQIIFTGSDILIGQIEKYHTEIPFLTTIKRINNFYTLT